MALCTGLRAYGSVLGLRTGQPGKGGHGRAWRNSGNVPHIWASPSATTTRAGRRRPRHRLPTTRRTEPAGETSCHLGCVAGTSPSTCPSRARSSRFLPRLPARLRGEGQRDVLEAFAPLAWHRWSLFPCGRTQATAPDLSCRASAIEQCGRAAPRRLESFDRAESVRMRLPVPNPQGPADRARERRMMRALLPA